MFLCINGQASAVECALQMDEERKWLHFILYERMKNISFSTSEPLKFVDSSGNKYI